MLFGLDEYNRVAALRFRAAMEALVPVVEPALRAFPVREMEAIPTAEVRVDDDRSVDLHPQHGTEVIRFDPRRVVAGDIAAVHEPLLAFARSVADRRLPYVRESLERITETTGQVVSVGKKMTWEDVMAAVESVQGVGFDEHDAPTFGFWPPQAQATYEALPPRNVEEERRWQELMGRKREEARARARDRRIR